MRSLQWDIFCKVIDNFGDIGVSWRLAADLASRGHRVRLWVDDTRALAWMAPEGCADVSVLPWTDRLDLTCLTDAPCDVMIETFGCDIAPDFIASCARIHSATGMNNLQLHVSSPPVWINLEYLTAELYAERSHGLNSLVAAGPAAGWKKWFFYPGFGGQSGSLLREPGLAQRQATFDRAAWLSSFNIPADGQILVFLFCYEPAALGALLHQLDAEGINGQPVTLLVAAGRTTHAVQHQIGLMRPGNACKQLSNLLSVNFLPSLTQLDFDHALWAADINFVRGEDSLVRAIWARRPFVWQIYPQQDGAQFPKLEAFLSVAELPESLREFHRLWNGPGNTTESPDIGRDWAAWQLGVQQLASRLWALPDLTAKLEQFVLKTR